MEAIHNISGTVTSHHYSLAPLALPPPRAPLLAPSTKPWLAHPSFNCLLSTQPLEQSSSVSSSPPCMSFVPVAQRLCANAFASLEGVLTFQWFFPFSLPGFQSSHKRLSAISTSRTSRPIVSSFALWLPLSGETLMHLSNQQLSNATTGS
jgi:hypothetical protein